MNHTFENKDENTYYKGKTSVVWNQNIKMFFMNFTRLEHCNNSVVEKSTKKVIILYKIARCFYN